MLRLHRATAFVFPLLLSALLGGCQASPPVVVPAAADPLQIHWQRSLDDALALAQQQNLPILLAVNMDGESASDRVVHEQYQDPALVAASRHYVCLVASVFRHNPRDYDDQGRRIPCPRLGSCTCGEHIALEPLMHDKWLADGERVAPRHAVIGQDGQKLWDMSLSFDLLDIDRAVIGSIGDKVLDERVEADWAALAGGRSRAAREAFEHALTLADASGVVAALAAIATHGDQGCLDALRVLLPRLGDASLRASFAAAVRQRSLTDPVAALLRDSLGGFTADGSAPAARDAWWALLLSLDAASDATRVLHTAQHGAFAIEQVQAAAARTLSDARGAVLPARSQTVATTADALLQELDEVEAAMRQRPDDAALRARYAKASLDLARLHIDTGERDVAILLADAELNFRRALDADAQHADWWIERARTAYYEQRFADELAHGRTALRIAIGSELEALPRDLPLQHALAVEALRWIADGAARSYGALLATDGAAAGQALQAALTAFGAVAASAFGDDRDWGSFASFCGSLGLWREQFLAARAGALRFPASPDCRQWLNDALWRAGPVEQVAAVADGIAAATAAMLGDEHPSVADAKWFAGYGCMLDAENQRRAVRNGAARQRYAAARERFAATAGLRPDYSDNCRYCIALTHLGEGFAAVRDGNRALAADQLVLAVQSWQDLSQAQDGLGYDVLDLVDKIGEWRANGPSEVDVEQLFERLEDVAPDTAFWAMALADSQLREALRADGRNPVRVERDTVDAAGEPIRMLLGVPNDEGDVYLRRALQLLRRVKERLVSDEDKKALAQCDTIWAERQFDRDRLGGVSEALQEAAELLAQPVPSADADAPTLRATAAALRAVLGEARPRWRIGR